MRLLFIDFDGVTHPLGLKDAEGRACEFFCWLPHLTNLLEGHPDVGLVAHTSWRESHTDEQLQAYLGALGPRYRGKPADGEKGPVIEAWMAEHAPAAEYLILDDVTLGLEVFPEERVVPCNFQKGLADPEVSARVATWLSETQAR